MNESEDLVVSHAIFGTDLSKPASELIYEIRTEISRLRGRLQDIARDRSEWKDELSIAQGGLTCMIRALHDTQERMKESEHERSRLEVDQNGDETS